MSNFESSFIYKQNANFYHILPQQIYTEQIVSSGIIYYKNTIYFFKYLMSASHWAKKWELKNKQKEILLSQWWMHEIKQINKHKHTITSARKKAEKD